MELTAIQKKKRLYMMLAGTFAIFFTGYPHIWSVYQPYTMAQTGWGQIEASMCFYLALCTFVFGNIIGGKMIHSCGEKKTIWIGGGIFSAGIILSAFFITPSPLPLYITYGIMQGFGQGMIYTTIITTAQKWFPDRTGFASGIVVTANGLCGSILAPISRVLLERYGLRYTFLTIGIVITISWLLNGVLFNAPEKKKVIVKYPIKKKDKQDSELNKTQYTSLEMFRTKKFYYLFATMCFGLMPYFMLSPISQNYQVEIGIPVYIAVGSIMFGSILNAGTRLLLPTVADKVGRIPCIYMNLLVSLITMISLCVFKSYFATVAIVLMYGCYGGIMGSFPAFTSDIFGLENAGENYGYVMLSMVIVTLSAPLISSLVLGNGYGMRGIFILGMIFSIMSIVCLKYLQKEIKS